MKQQKHWLLLLQCFCILLLPFFGKTQKAIITEIKEMHPLKKEINVFPVIQIPGNKKVSFLINQKLREEALYLDSTGFKKSIFEIAWFRDDSNNPYWEYDDFEYEVFSNTARFLNLSILFSGGKHCQSQTLYFLFDTKTGEDISFKKILNSEGQKWLIQKMVELQKQRIRKILPALRDSIQLPPNPKNPYDSLSKDDFQREYEMYERCLTSSLPSYLTYPDALDYFEIYLKDNILNVKGCACAGNWNTQRLDELGDAKFQLPVKEIEHFLTEMGRRLMLGVEK
jgi:hypothetical protein